VLIPFVAALLRRPLDVMLAGDLLVRLRFAFKSCLLSFGGMVLLMVLRPPAFLTLFLWLTW
jgi:hypothetical protein